MRFTLVDRITELQPPRITVVKCLSLAEEYLADHFPAAPVIPGVMMLECMVQASAWLIRSNEDFAHSMVTLKQARGVKYANFVEPGQRLEVSAEIKGQDDRETKITAQGTVDGEPAVSGKLVLERFNLADEDPSQTAADAFILERLRQLFSLLHPPA